MRFFEDPSCAKGNRQPDATFCKRISPYLSYEIVFVATLCFFGTPKLKLSRVIRKFANSKFEILKFENLNVCFLNERADFCLVFCTNERLQTRIHISNAYSPARRITKFGIHVTADCYKVCNTAAFTRDRYFASYTFTTLRLNTFEHSTTLKSFNVVSLRLHELNAS